MEAQLRGKRSVSHLNLFPGLLAEEDNLLLAAWVRAQREVSIALVRRGQVLGARRSKKKKKNLQDHEA